MGGWYAVEEAKLLGELREGDTVDRGGELGRVPGLLGGDGLGRGALPLQLVLGGLLLSGRSFGLLGGGVQILAVVVTEWLRLGSLGRVPCLTTGHFAYFTFGRKIVLAFRAVRRVSNHFGIGNVSFWQRTRRENKLYYD